LALSVLIALEMKGFYDPTRDAQRPPLEKLLGPPPKRKIFEIVN